MKFSERLEKSFNSTSLTKNDIELINQYNKAIKDGGKTTEELNDILSGASSSAKKMAASVKGTEINIDAMASAEKSATMTSKALGIGLRAIGNLAFSALITLAITGLEKLITIEKRAKEHFDELSQGFYDSTTQIKNEQKELDDLTSQYIQIVANTKDLTTAKDQLSSIQDSLISQLGDEAKKIDLVNGKISEQINLLIEQKKKQLEIWKGESSGIKDPNNDDKYLTNEYAAKEAEKQLEKRSTFSKRAGRSYSDPDTFGSVYTYDFKKGVDFNSIDSPGYGDWDDFEEVKNIVSKNKNVAINSDNGDYLYFVGTMQERLESMQFVYNELSEKWKNLKDDDTRVNWLSDMSSQISDLQSNYTKLTSAVEEYNKVQKQINSLNASEKTKDDIKDLIDKTVVEKNNLLTALDNKDVGTISKSSSTLTSYHNQLIKLAGDSEDIKKVVNDLFDNIPKDFRTDIFDMSQWTDQIDNVQDRISKLSSALEKLKSGELSDAERIDLAQEFTDLAPYINDTDRLAAEIQKLAKVQPNTLIAKLETLKANLKTDEEVKQVDNLIKILQKLGIVSSKSEGKSGEELANDYLKLQENKIDKIIDKIEDRKKAEEKVLESMQKQKDSMEEQKEILQKQKEELEKQKEAVEDIVSDYETAGNTVTSFLDDKIEELTTAKENLEKSYDDEIKKTQDKYNDEIDALKEKNDAINRSIELKKAEDELYNARNTKVRVYSESGGYVEQVNASAVREKQQNLDSLKRGYKIEDLESERDKEVKRIETNKENDPKLAQYEKDIKAYEDYKKSFEDMVSSYQRNQDNLTTARILGANWHELVTNKDTGLIQKYGSEYNRYQIQLNEDIPLEIEAKELAIEEQEKIIENQDKAIQKQQEVIDGKDKEIQSWNEYKDDLAGAVEEIMGTNDGYVNSLDNIVLSEKSSYEDRIKELKKFQKTIRDLKNSDSNEQDEQIVNDYLNSPDESTSTKNKESAAKNATRNIANAAIAGAQAGLNALPYKLYYIDRHGQKKVVGSYKGRTKATIAKSNIITDYAERYGDHPTALNRKFNLKLTSSDSEYQIREALTHAFKIDSFAKGGINDYTGLAMLHGTKQQSEVIFNSADAKKLYYYIHTSNNLPETLTVNIGNSISKMFEEVTSKMGNNTEYNKNSSSKSTTVVININNPNIQADSQAQFEQCMSQYITKQKLDTWVGK